MSVDIAIWVLVVVVAVVAIFVIRLLNQLTSVATETELAMRNLNSQIPRIVDKADQVLENADCAIARVNQTLDDLEAPVNLIKTATGFLGDSRKLARIGGGQNALALIAGFKLVKTLFDHVKKHFAKRHGKSEEA